MERLDASLSFFSTTVAFLKYFQYLCKNIPYEKQDNSSSNLIACRNILRDKRIRQCRLIWDSIL